MPAPDTTDLRRLQHRLYCRFPGVDVEVEAYVDRRGDRVQRVRYQGPVDLLEHYAITTRAFLTTERDGRHRPVLDASGSEVVGGTYLDDGGEHGYLFVSTVIETARKEHLPKWAQVGGERIVRRLQNPR